MYQLMYITVSMVLTTTQCAEAVTENQKRIIDEAVQCVMDTMPLDFLEGGDLYKKKYIFDISSQWDPLTHMII